MPELPEVETVARGLRETILQSTVISFQLNHSDVLVNKSSAEPAEVFHDNVFEAVSRTGKYLCLALRSGHHIVVHLRMTGKMLVGPITADRAKHDHIKLTFANGQQLVFNDTRRFGRWVLLDENTSCSAVINVGPDALEISLADLRKLIKRTPQRKLKAFLLDQTRLAGIGNIYADEIACRLHVDPEIPVGRVTVTKLHEAIRSILLRAIELKGTTISDYARASGKAGNFQHELKIYGQKICSTCGGAVLKKSVAGRSTHYCPVCQRSR